TAGIRGLLCQLSDHQDLTVEEKCQRRLCVQRVWPLSEAPLDSQAVEHHQAEQRRADHPSAHAETPEP
ncbi:uncharacterized protein DAT39_016756, partial [Clarias magur]